MDKRTRLHRLALAITVICYYYPCAASIVAARVATAGTRKQKERSKKEKEIRNMANLRNHPKAERDPPVKSLKFPVLRTPSPDR